MRIFIALLLFHTSSAVIYNLDDADYIKMPPLFHLDNYERCVRPGGIYCSGQLNLMSDKPSDLLNMIQEYSDQTIKHFNYTRLFYGVCLTNKCNIPKNDIIDNPTQSFEKCLNDIMMKNYQLQARASSVSCNIDVDDDIDNSDVTVIVVCCLLILINAVGSVYGFDKITGNEWLLCFSMKHNWEKLKAPYVEETSRRMFSLKSLSGFRTIMTMLVIMCHCLMPYILTLAYPKDLEVKYEILLFHILLNGTLAVQTFFILSGFLLVYNILKYSMNNTLSWWVIPIGIFRRWLRMIPLYALVLAVKSTIIRHAGAGPLWQKTVMSEYENCRRYWWQNILFINNCNHEIGCMTETWYLAADMQLHVIGLFLCVLIYKIGCMKRILTLSFFIGIAIPVVITYLHKLDAILVVSPEVGREFFSNSPTFHHTYKPSYTNMSCFIMGMAMAHLLHHYHQCNRKIVITKIHRYIYWLSFPLAAGVLLAVKVIYIDGLYLPLYLKAILSGLLKPLFGLFSGAIIFGSILQIETLYRGVLEWDGWTILNRLAYSAYLLHTLVVRHYSGMMTTLTALSMFSVFINIIGTISVLFIVSIPCWLFVEAPFSKLVSLCMKPKKKIVEKNSNENESTRSKL